MTTIPQRLREIAVDVGQQNMAAYVKLRAIAAELEAPPPAADAVPVVGYLFSRPGISKIDVAPHGGDWEKLIRQRDHLATVAALQARINDLESRQVEIFEAVDRLGDVRAFLNGYILSNSCRQNYLEGTVQKWIDGFYALYSLEDAASKDHK